MQKTKWEQVQKYENVKLRNNMNQSNMTCLLSFCASGLKICLVLNDLFSMSHKIKGNCFQIQFASIVLRLTAEKADQILPLRHNPLPSDKQDTICCHWAGRWLDGGVKGAGWPWAASRAVWNHRSSHDRAAGAQGHSGHFYWWHP